MKERFRKIDNNGAKFSHYLVSNMGRVLSTWRKNRHILKPYTVGGNHKVVKLTDDDGNTHQFYVHRLVAQAFIANPDNSPEINHKNENPSDNRAENLEWCDRLYNMRYGTWVERAKATKELRRKGPTMLGYLVIDLEIARNYGVSVGMLVGAVHRLFEVRKVNKKLECYLSMKDMVKATGMSYRTVREAAKKAQGAGLIDFRFGYKPSTTEKTTYWKLLWEGYNDLQSRMARRDQH